jgi:hypothetical protein
MFFGLFDDSGRALHPKAAQRIPFETIQWSMEYLAKGRVQTVNLRVVRIHVYAQIAVPKFFGLFREVDDADAFAGAFPLMVHYRGSYIPAGSYIEIAPRHLRLESTFNNEIAIAQ